MNFFKRLGTKEAMVQISDFLRPDLVSFLTTSSRDDALEELVDLLNEKGYLQDKEPFFAAIQERERVVSTGIGLGVAIPHAKLPGYDHFFIAVGIQKKGIDWNALDGAPVQWIFMIGGPDNQQTQYLQILSQLTSALKSDERREAMQQCETAEEIVALFEHC